MRLMFEDHSNVNEDDANRVRVVGDLDRSNQELNCQRRTQHQRVKAQQIQNE
ncbi:hypothetical protein PPACK8108_LOCUS297 [Phakopsora pachyrhizi]|uniref:Uncharacterized protein n=1 Tax=Phakopsora pachyrhizi TaxID=170000 RepID=A0AAV0AFP6_PHAPC|nr:hypothetical protein PPACK8108_LOCUS297 [Phakopsora pachyrhizi]